MKTKQGFTLIEFLIYIGLLSILLAIMSQVFLATLSIRTESEGATNIQQDGRYILSRLTYDVYRAKSISAPAVGSTGGALSLTITENGTDVSYRYSTASGNLWLTIGAANPVQLNSSTVTLTAFSIQRIGNSGQILDARDTAKIHIGLQGKSDVSQGAKNLLLDTTLGLR